jgi:hypothetical protein
MPESLGTASFSPEESELILSAITAEAAKVQCPRCGQKLVSDLPRGGRCNTPEVWELHCSACRVSVLVPDDRPL